MESFPLRVPEPVRLRAVSEGEAGGTWLAGLPAAVAELAMEWTLALGPTLPGGTEACVIAAAMPDGREAVLKVAPPWRDPAARELDALLLARGRGYADVYRHDRARRAILLERLGPRLADLGWSTDAQAEAICETLRHAWTSPDAGSDFMTGKEKAESLGQFIEETWLELGRPCPERTIGAVLRCAEDRRRAFDARVAVLSHGDCHPWNTLRLPGCGPDRFKFIDPDGLYIERAYDLGILMREWNARMEPGAAGR